MGVENTYIGLFWFFDDFDKWEYIRQPVSDVLKTKDSKARYITSDLSHVMLWEREIKQKLNMSGRRTSRNSSE